MKARNIIIYGLIVLGICFSCNQHPQDLKNNEVVAFGWKPVYQNDEDGNRLSGNIDSLIAGIRNGYDVRVGWGWKKEMGDAILGVEHMAEPIFLTIIQEKDVSVIIDAHPLMESYIDKKNQTFSESGAIWQCVLTTKGTFNAQVHNRATGELIKDWPQRHKMTWFLDYPGNLTRSNKPLFD